MSANMAGLKEEVIFIFCRRLSVCGAKPKLVNGLATGFWPETKYQEIKSKPSRIQNKSEIGLLSKIIFKTDFWWERFVIIEYIKTPNSNIILIINRDLRMIFFNW